MEGTFHRRVLKSPAVAFSSVEGKRLFQVALKEGHMEGYFHIAEHFITQGHPAFCGIGSLTMSLNSLLLDPKRIWQGVWRWFDESMLDCCEPLDVVKLKGITLPKLSCLARCNGASSTLIYGDAVSLDEFRQDVIRACTADVEDILDTALSNFDGCCSSKVATSDQQWPISSTNNSDDVPSKACCHSQASPGGPRSCPERGTGRTVLIVAYNRRDMNQSGSGHFSPIGGYCAAEDLVLIMDVARFKYPPHWVPLASLHLAMQAVDPDTGRCRGYLRVRALPEMARRCECAELCTGLPAPIVAVDADSTGLPSVAQVEEMPLLEIQTVPTPLVEAAVEAAAHATHDAVMERVEALLHHSCPMCSK